LIGKGKNIPTYLSYVNEIEPYLFHVVFFPFGKMVQRLNIFESNYMMPTCTPIKTQGDFSRK